MNQNGFFKLSLFAHLLISSFIIAIVCILFSLYASITYFNNERLDDALLMVDQTNQQLIQKITAYVSPAILIAQQSAKLIEASHLTLSDIEHFESYALTMIQPFTQLRALYYGDKQGNFFVTKRMPDNRFQSRSISTKTSPAISITYNRNPFNQLLYSETAVSKYDPRIRPWYQGVRQHQSSYWTNVYRFYETDIFGITAAYPVFNKKDYLKGAFGVDINISKISEFLSQQSFGKNSQIVIYDQNRKIVASNLKDDTALALTSVTHPIIQSALKIAQKKDAKPVFDIDKKFIISIRKFEETIGDQWTVMMVVPVKDVLVYKSSFISIEWVIGFALFFCCLFVYLYLVYRPLSKSMGLLISDLDQIIYKRYNAEPNYFSSIQEIIECESQVRALKQRLKTE